MLSPNKNGSPSRAVAPTVDGGGRKFADRLALPVVGAEGHDLKCGCEFCGSSDAARVHKDTGFFHCYACQKNLSAWDYSKLKFGHDEGKRVMIELGLFEDWSNGNGSNGHSSPAVHQGNGKAAPMTDEQAFLEVCRLKNVPPDAWKAYGAVAYRGGVKVPMFGPTVGPDGLESCSSIHITPENGKGKYEWNRPVGIFLPGEFPDPGQSCLIVEGPKDPPALHSLGHLAIGLPGNRLNKDFAPLFKGVHVTILTDGDKPGRDGGATTAKLLRAAGAASVKIASFPDGKDARDVLKEQGPEGIGRVLLGATESGEEEEPIPPPCSLRELITTYPTLRPAVIDGLLRVGETANIVAHPKRGKSWLVNSLALSVSAGGRWLDTFQCARGRVLLIDAELYREDIAYRLPLVANAMLLNPDYVDSIDVWALRGLGVDLVKLGPMLDSIEPGRYALIILDAWYRFLPIGFSENDNAQVMALYNKIDAYASRLGAAWVNVHHASKGDQSGKGVTDVGSGAGSQSRAADTHLIIRQHEQEDVAVIEAVVRSWPPVERFAIRWNFPTWDLDAEADPRKLWGARQSRDRATSEAKDIHLNEDRQGIVNAMVGNADLQTKTEIRDSARIGNPRFGFAWASLLADGTIIPAGETTKGNNRKYEAFALSHKEPEF